MSWTLGLQTMSTFPSSSPSFLPFLPPVSPTLLCVSSLWSDITLCNALFSLRIVVLEAVSTKERRIKPLPLSHPPIRSFLPSFPPASIPSHLSSIAPPTPHFSHFTSFASPLSFCHPVPGNLFLQIFIIFPNSSTWSFLFLAPQSSQLLF